jgi:ankyrin repeat protein
VWRDSQHHHRHNLSSFRYGADPNAPDEIGNTPAHLAALNSRLHWMVNLINLMFMEVI